MQIVLFFIKKLILYDKLCNKKYAVLHVKCKRVRVMMVNATLINISCHIVVVCCIGGGNMSPRRKPDVASH